MPSTSYTVPEIIEISNISLVYINRDIRNANFSTNQALDKRHPILLRMEKKSLEWYNVFGTDVPTLSKMADWVLSLCGGYLNQALTLINNLTQTAPIITGPSNQSILVGANASFTISVTSALPYAIAWYRDGILIPGEVGLTYTLSNGQVGDSGSTFFARVTNAAGTNPSATATLTVTASIVGQWYAGATDYSSDLLSGVDSVAYSGTFSITDGQPFNVPFPIGQSDFVVIKYPISQALRVHYENPAAGIDQAAIPGLAFDQNTFGGNNYTFSRSGNQFGINNTTGIVQFS